MNCPRCLAIRLSVFLSVFLSVRLSIGAREPSSKMILKLTIGLVSIVFIIEESSSHTSPVICERVRILLKLRSVPQQRGLLNGRCSQLCDEQSVRLKGSCDVLSAVFKALLVIGKALC